ncbi:MAG: hypothetical protein H8D97_00275 [Proteobacteria bacterium]|nr:hypothetical protein [Pseudomonadota bacterium]
MKIEKVQKGKIELTIPIKESNENTRCHKIEIDYMEAKNIAKELEKLSKEIEQDSWFGMH